MVVRVTAPDGLRVRRTPDAATTANVLGGLRPHEEIEALAREGEWLRVTYKNESAFIHGGYVEPVAGQPGRDERAAAPTPATTHAESSAPASEPAHVESNPATAAERPAPAAERPARVPTNGEFTALSGNSIAKTTPKEAEVLNELRADPRRFDPAWLLGAQRALGVVDATGAFNTETLRAMRTRAGNPSLGADGILSSTFLTGLAPGNPFMSQETGFSDDEPDATAKSPADRAAQAVGYASYRDYRKEWVDITFLGKPLKGGHTSGQGHPYLAARLKSAEAFLRQRHPSAKGDDGVIKAIGWNGAGNAAYSDHVGAKTSHQHTMGLAIDIDPGQNPYIFNEHVEGLTHEQSMWWISAFEEMFKIATRLYGGDPIKPDTLLAWSRTSSTEELFQRIQATSRSFAKLLELSKKPEETIRAELQRAGYRADEIKTELPKVQKAEPLFHNGGGRQNAKSITNISEELLVALRDVAGLSWGGTEMSARENGDFMHFDCRDTEFGRAVYTKQAPAKRK